MQSYLSRLHQQYANVPIDKARNKLAFVCKSYCRYHIRLEIGILNGDSVTYCLANKDIKEILENNVQICRSFGLELIENQKCPPLMYCIPKLHKIPVGGRFRNCIEKM